MNISVPCDIPALNGDILHICMQMLRIESDLQKDKCHYTIITNKNRIVSIGTNKLFKTSPLAKRYGYRYGAYHSELTAWQNAPRDLDFSKCRLWNVRLSRLSRKIGRPIIRMARPCPICAAWLKPLNFREIIYTTDVGWSKL